MASEVGILGQNFLEKILVNSCSYECDKVLIKLNNYDELVSMD